MDSRLQAIFFDLTFPDSQYITSSVRGTSSYWRRYRSLDQATEETRQELTRVVLDLDERGKVPKCFSTSSPEECFRGYAFTCMKHYWLKALIVRPAPTDHEGNDVVGEPVDTGGVTPLNRPDVRSLFERIIGSPLGETEFNILLALVNDNAGVSSAWRSVAISVLRRQLVQPGRAIRPTTPAVATTVIGEGDLRAAFNRRKRWLAVGRMATALRPPQSV